MTRLRPLLLVLALTLLAPAAASAASPPPGTLVSDFGTNGFVSKGPATIGSSVLVQSDGKILVEGQDQSTGSSSITVSRYKANGQPDGCFGIASCAGSGTGTGTVTAHQAPSWSYTGRGLALQSDGKILVAGVVRSPDSGNTMAVMRLNANGTVDTTFGGTDKGTALIPLCNGTSASSVSVSQGAVIVVGSADCNGSSRVLVAKLSANGTLDPSFGGGNGWVMMSPPTVGWDGAVLSNGNIAVASHFQASDRDYCMAMELTSTGAPVASFNGGGTFFSTGSCREAYNVVASTGGSAIFSGSGFTNQVVISAAKLSSTASGVTDFGSSNGEATIAGGWFGSQTMATAQGKLIFGGVRGWVVRANANGSADTSFGNGGGTQFLYPRAEFNDVNGVAVSPDGSRIYAVGNWNEPNKGPIHQLLVALQG